ncbi:MAG TPA: YhfC family glutamic-type intramembrane protease [Ktedonobacteraceae bacterium]|jgi:uncharacterized membrane protein YhfC|nr:YhfC family glutamic-type intramembrane protease [Ktedonobacteraceae bacterium]
MPSHVQVNGYWLLVALIADVCVILYPIVLAIIAHRRLHVSWKYFGFGALIFFLFQVISRVPLVTWLGSVLAPQLNASPLFFYIWLTALALTAGLFEEVGRYVGYRWFMRREEKTWNKAVMYGLGHGGLESILLVGGLGLLTIVNLSALSSLDLNSLPAAQHGQIVQQVNAINAQPTWFPLLSFWERIWTVPVHVGLSVMVLQVFRRKQLNWLWLAILAHALLDFVAVAILHVFGSSVLVYIIDELVIAAFGVAAIWITLKLRDKPETLATETPHPLAQEMA